MDDGIESGEPNLEAVIDTGVAILSVKASHKHGLTGCA